MMAHLIYLIAMIIRRLAQPLKSLGLTPRREYHILSLLESKYEQEQAKLNPRLFHLYLDRLRTAPFSERFLAVLAVDCFRTAQPQDQFRRIVDFALDNLEKFESRTSIVALLNQIYHYKAAEKNEVDRLVRRALEIEERDDSGYAYFNLKLLILISELVGLEKYPEDLYRKIDFKKFKPLTIAMVLELFYEKHLEKEFKLTDELVDMFVACEAFIPFADVHHLSYAIRKINNDKFRECFYRVRRKIQATLSKGEEREQKSEKQEVGKWTTDEELLALFRKNIEDKYRLVQ